jgi:hypothetical protein
VIARIVGDGTYLSLIDPLRYASFAGENWATNDRVLEPHFIEEMQNQSALVWATGFETDWRVEVREGISNETGYREQSGSIENSGDTLIMANYDALSMCAQFDNEKVAEQDHGICKIPLPQGRYKIRVVQLIDPETYDFDENNRAAEFLLEYAKADSPMPAWTSVPWSSL